MESVYFKGKIALGLLIMTVAIAGKAYAACPPTCSATAPATALSRTGYVPAPGQPVLPASNTNNSGGTLSGGGSGSATPTTSAFLAGTPLQPASQPAPAPPSGSTSARPPVINGGGTIGNSPVLQVRAPAPTAPQNPSAGPRPLVVSGGRGTASRSAAAPRMP